MGILSRSALGTAVLLLGSHDTGIIVRKLPGTGDAARLIDCLRGVHEAGVVVPGTA